MVEMIKEMARSNNLEPCGRVNGGKNGRKYGGGNTKYFKSITPPQHQHSGENSPQRLSPRTSPGLLAGHYAGCKFNEPPLPSTLPPPPQHWMQQPRAPMGHCKPCPEDHLARQLKILLKVQD